MQHSGGLPPRPPSVAAVPGPGLPDPLDGHPVYVSHEEVSLQLPGAACQEVGLCGALARACLRPWPAACWPAQHPGQPPCSPAPPAAAAQGDQRPQAWAQVERAHVRGQVLPRRHAGARAFGSHGWVVRRGWVEAVASGGSTFTPAWRCFEAQQRAPELRRTAAGSACAGVHVQPHGARRLGRPSCHGRARHCVPAGEDQGDAHYLYENSTGFPFLRANNKNVRPDVLGRGSMSSSGDGGRWGGNGRFQAAPASPVVCL